MYGWNDNDKLIEIMILKFRIVVASAGTSGIDESLFPCYSGYRSNFLFSLLEYVEMTKLKKKK